MGARLKLISTPPERSAPEFAPARFDLRVQPTRPGVAYEPLPITPRAETLATLSCVCALEGLPAESWAALAIETSRALILACELINIRAGELARILDRAAAAPRCERVPAGPGGLLVAYARALRAAPPRRADSACSQMILPVPYVAVVAWQRAAAASGAAVGDWAVSMLEHLAAGRVAWEAAAAEGGQTLCEWVLTQAASCCSRSSAAAHSAG